MTTGQQRASEMSRTTGRQPVRTTHGGRKPSECSHTGPHALPLLRWTCRDTEHRSCTMSLRQGRGRQHRPIIAFPCTAFNQSRLAHSHTERADFEARRQCQSTQILPKSGLGCLLLAIRAWRRNWRAIAAQIALSAASSQRSCRSCAKLSMTKLRTSCVRCGRRMPVCARTWSVQLKPKLVMSPHLLWIPADLAWEPLCLSFPARPAPASRAVEQRWPKLLQRLVRHTIALLKTSLQSLRLMLGLLRRQRLQRRLRLLRAQRALLHVPYQLRPLLMTPRALLVRQLLLLLLRLLRIRWIMLRRLRALMVHHSRLPPHTMMLNCRNQLPRRRLLLSLLLPPLLLQRLAAWLRCTMMPRTTLLLRTRPMPPQLRPHSQSPHLPSSRLPAPTRCMTTLPMATLCPLAPLAFCLRPRLRHRCRRRRRCRPHCPPRLPRVLLLCFLRRLIAQKMA